MIELFEGLRVTVETGGEITCVAVIDSLSDDGVELNLLELEESLELDSVITVIVPDAGGLHYWPAHLLKTPVDRRLSLTLIGPRWTVQRRRYPRFAVDLEARLRRVRPGRQFGPEGVRIVDLSHGGARVVGTAALSTGDAVVLNLDLGNGPLTAAGRVAMAYPDGMGRRVSHLAFAESEDTTPAVDDIDRYLRTVEAAAPS
jgi:Tfp pilus assembly protein PilZ